MSIWETISAVQKEVSEKGIAKDQSGYQFKFRGIDQVYNTLSPIFASCGLVVLPKVVHWDTVERKGAKGGIQFHTKVTVEYTLGCKSGEALVITGCGEAFDNADKSTSKALSMAYKTTMFQLLCIPLEGQDPDAIQYEQDEVVIEEPNLPPESLLKKLEKKVIAGAGTAESAINYLLSKYEIDATIQARMAEAEKLCNEKAKEESA